MIGRHVDQTRTAVGGDEIAREQRTRFGVEPAEVVHRVTGNGSGEVGAFDRRVNFRIGIDVFLYSDTLDINIAEVQRLGRSANSIGERCGQFLRDQEFGNMVHVERVARRSQNLVDLRVTIPAKSDGIRSDR